MPLLGRNLGKKWNVFYASDIQIHSLFGHELSSLKMIAMFKCLTIVYYIVLYFRRDSCYLLDLSVNI